MNTGKLVITGGLWTAALFLIACYAVLPFDTHGLGVAGIFVAQVALGLTVSVLFDRHRLRVSEILLMAEAERARRSADVRPIR